MERCKLQEGVARGGEKKEANQCLNFLHFHSTTFKLLYQKKDALIFQIQASKSII